MLWGPIVYEPGPFTRVGPGGPSRRGLWPKLNNIKYKIALGYSRGHFSHRQNQNPIWKKGKNSRGLSLKENLKISRESCPHCHSMLCAWQSRFLRLLQPPPTTLGMGWWDKYQSWKGWPYTWTKDNERRLI